MLPGFVPSFIHYLMSPDVRKNIPYGTRLRQQLDVYMPRNSASSGGDKIGPKRASEPAPKAAPVVIFVSGGAWIIGYKVWGFIMGRILQQNGVLCVCPDYRNFPQGSVADMVSDVNQAIEWTFANITSYGGDPSRVTLVGQSAGAHLTACLLLARVRDKLGLGATAGAKESEPDMKGDSNVTRKGWALESIRDWVGISGPYDIKSVIPSMHSRGLHRRVLARLFDNLDVQSPIHCLEHIAESRGARQAMSALPRMHLFHGSNDATVDCKQSTDFAEALKGLGVKANVLLFQGKSHTDPVLEDPVTGADPLTEELLRIATGAKCAVTPLPHTQPRVLTWAAKICNPF